MTVWGITESWFQIDKFSMWLVDTVKHLAVKQAIFLHKMVKTESEPKTGCILDVCHPLRDMKGEYRQLLPNMLTISAIMTPKS